MESTKTVCVLQLCRLLNEKLQFCGQKSIFRHQVEFQAPKIIILNRQIYGQIYNKEKKLTS